MENIKSQQYSLHNKSSSDVNVDIPSIYLKSHRMILLFLTYFANGKV